MESSDAASQLDGVERLRRETAGESLQGDRRALAVLAVATVLFFASYESEVSWQPVVAPVVWIAFIVAWVKWLRRSNSARYARRQGVARRDVVEWLVLTTAAIGISILGARVSWLLAGVLFASIGTIVGAVEALIGRSRLRGQPGR